jgi:hypothetical protein
MMKKMTKIAMLTTLGLTLGTTLVAENNALTNSGFEQPLKAWKNYQGQKPQLVDDGINRSKCLKTLATIKAGKQFKSNVFQDINSLTAGKYVFSGYFKGDVAALWLVISFDKTGQGKGAKFTKWLAKSKFKASDIVGWNRFSFMITVPAETVKGQLVIEAFCNQKATAVLLDDIKLVKQED